MNDECPRCGAMMGEGARKCRACGCRPSTAPTGEPDGPSELNPWAVAWAALLVVGFLVGFVGLLAIKNREGWRFD